MPYADPTSEVARASQKRASRKHYALNREALIAQSAAYNSANKEKVNKAASVRRSTKTPPEKVLWCNASNRAKARNIPFEIEVSDIIIPSVCPVLGMPLVVGTGYARDNSPSLDRIVPSLGYIKGNIAVLSHKANTMKSNADVEDVRKLLNYMERSNG